jgi:LAS superfamily LD-carboxypeptidase LdcB
MSLRSNVVPSLLFGGGAAFNAMNAAHAAERGHAIPVTDSYRDYAGQVDVHGRKPHLAATPGNSNHGWGLAVDMAVGGWNGEVFRWLQANAHRYGWHHPPWARIDGSKPEPWHWEYGGSE